SGTITLYFPAKEGQAVTLQKERSADIMVVSDAAYFDSNSGLLLKKLPFDQLSNGSKLRKLNLPIHSGSILGWPTKLLALIVALFTVSLPITGVLIWWRTGKKKKKVKPGSKLFTAA
ncbi:MAG: PepSY domain-containing protein, partial [Pedobacter sp.]|nr:PepSY domain-containing protein [Pedobacter sp.]